MDTLEIIKKGENEKKTKLSVFLERKKLEKIREETLKRTKSAVSPSGKSTLLRKLAQKNSVTSVRNMEVLIRPIILGTVRSTMKHGVQVFFVLRVRSFTPKIADSRS